MPKVSVIIPNYNHAKYLQNRIETVLNQSFQDFEVIMMDDCSVDQSREIFDRYKDHPKISRVIYNEKNSGSTFRQWNTGISLAKGDYIWIAESDDYCEPNFLEETVKQLNECPSAGIAYVQSREFDEATGESILSFAHDKSLSKLVSQSYFNKGKIEIAEKLIYTNTIPNASAVLFRKEIYYACGGANEDMKLCGDWLLWVKMLLISDICYVAKPINYFRLTPISVRNQRPWVSTVHERLIVLHCFEDQKIQQKIVASSQIAMLRRVFNSYPFAQTQRAFGLILKNKMLVHNAIAKSIYAFSLSIKDRLAKAIWHRSLSGSVSVVQ